MTRTILLVDPLLLRPNAEHRIPPVVLPIGVVFSNGIVVVKGWQETFTTIAERAAACEGRSNIAPMWYEDWYVQRLSDVAKCWPTLHR